MYDLYLNYTERRSGGEAVDPDDRWTWHEPEYIDWHPTGIFSKREDAGVFADGLSENEIHGEFQPGSVGHLVVVRHQTGSTFGTQHGYWHLIGFYASSEEASNVKKSIEDDSYEGYKPWLGYFERLEDVEIHTMVVS